MEIAAFVVGIFLLIVSLELYNRFVTKPRNKRQKQELDDTMNHYLNTIRSEVEKLSSLKSAIIELDKACRSIVDSNTTGFLGNKNRIN